MINTSDLRQSPVIQSNGCYTKINSLYNLNRDTATLYRIWLDDISFPDYFLMDTIPDIYSDARQLVDLYLELFPFLRLNSHQSCIFVLL